MENKKSFIDTKKIKSGLREIGAIVSHTLGTPPQFTLNLNFGTISRLLVFAAIGFERQK